MRLIGAGVSPIGHAGGLGSGGAGYALGEIALSDRDLGAEFIPTDGRTLPADTYPEGHEYGIPDVAAYAQSGGTYDDVLPAGHNVASSSGNVFVDRHPTTGVILAVSTIAAVDGNPLCVSRSIDNGKSFTLVSSSLGTIRYLTDLVAGASGVWYATGAPAGTSNATNLLFKSTDDGATWADITAPLFASVPNTGGATKHVGGVVYHNGVLYASTTSSASTLPNSSGLHYLSRSADGGVSWLTSAGANAGGMFYPRPPLKVTNTDTSVTHILLQIMGFTFSSTMEFRAWNTASIFSAGVALLAFGGGTLSGSSGLQNVRRKGAFYDPATGTFWVNFGGSSIMEFAGTSSFAVGRTLSVSIGGVISVRFFRESGGRLLMLAVGSGEFRVYSNTIYVPASGSGSTFPNGAVFSGIGSGGSAGSTSPAYGQAEALLLPDLSLLTSGGGWLRRFKPLRRTPALVSANYKKSYQMRVYK